MKKTIIAVFLFIAIFSMIAKATDEKIFFSDDEAFFFGGYCYYIENGDIYRAPLTEMAGDTELFREDSNGIYLNADLLYSIDKYGDISSYSLVSDAIGAASSNYFSGNSYDDEMLLGSLSAKYESNGNPAAISSGNGDAGGASFGAYQFASNAGVPTAFANWCITTGKSTDIGNRLLEAYAADSNSCGATFKAVWKAIAAEDADFFLSLQHGYVKEKYYDAIVARIEKNVANFDMDMYGIALRNVFWSRATQHGVGGSYNVITRAFDNLGGFALQSEEILIRAIYAESGAVVDTGTNMMTGSTAEQYGIAGKYMKYYSRNSSAVQVSVYRRLNINELSEALKMLDTYGGYVSSEDTPFEISGIRADSITDSSAMLFGTIYNYRIANITEYGFFIGKSMSTLVEFPISKNVTTNPVVSFSASTTVYSPELDPGTVYYFGVYALIDGEYASSDIFSFSTTDTRLYKAKFVNYNGDTLYEVALRKGKTPTYSGEAPQRTADEKYTYTFIGWDKEIAPIESDTVYTALYKETLNSYTVKYLSEDGALLYECKVNYGENAEYVGETPLKEGNKQFKYVFSTWSTGEENVTSNRELRPIFNSADYMWRGRLAESFCGGSGKKDDPYMISCGDELAYLSSYVAEGGETVGKYFSLGDNIVLGKHENFELFTPIGTENHPFSGSFDGCGFKIIGLNIKTDSSAGLFGFLNGARIENIILEDINVEGDIAGGLVGKAIASEGSETYIANCKVSGDIKGESYAGSLIGYAEGDVSISDISTSGSSKGNICGGICGHFGGRLLSLSFSDANVSGGTADMICGYYTDNSLINNCYFYSTLSSNIGISIPQNKLNYESSYQNFNFNEKWIISEGKAELKIAADNDFYYRVYGDADESGRTDVTDVIMIAQYVAKWEIELTPSFELQADFDGSGEIDAFDIILLCQYIAGWNVEPCW